MIASGRCAVADTGRDAVATERVRLRTVIAIFAIVRSAAADEAATAQSDHERGLQLAERGECRAAIPVLERAYAAAHSPATLLRLARCHEQVGDRDTAVVYYQRLVEEGRDPTASEEARDALARIAAVDPNARRAVPSGSASPTPPRPASSSATTPGVSAHQTGAERPSPTPGWGLRASVAPGVVLPHSAFGDLASTSFGLASRIGAERTWQRFGLTPALRLDFVRWSLAREFEQALAEFGTETSGHTLHVGLDVRAARHAHRVVLFVSCGAGLDLHRWENTEDDGLGPGVNIGAGADRRLGRRAAIGVALTWHPGLSEMVAVPDSPRVAYLALQVAGSLY